jgi:hypothetical protein
MEPLEGQRISQTLRINLKAPHHGPNPQNKTAPIPATHTKTGQTRRRILSK